MIKIPDDLFVGWRTYQALPYDLIFFVMNEKYEDTFGTVIGVQTDWKRKRKGIRWQCESNRKPTIGELERYSEKAKHDLISNDVKIIDGVSSKGILEHHHRLITNTYDTISIGSRKNPDLYFKISQLMRQSPHELFGECYELEKVTELLNDHVQKLKDDKSWRAKTSR